MTIDFYTQSEREREGGREVKEKFENKFWGTREEVSGEGGRGAGGVDKNLKEYSIAWAGGCRGGKDGDKGGIGGGKQRRRECKWSQTEA